MHLLCALCTPGVQFEDTEGLRWVSLDFILPSRWSSKVYTVFYTYLFEYCVFSMWVLMWMCMYVCMCKRERALESVYT